jgi:hypothetical protein
LRAVARPMPLDAPVTSTTALSVSAFSSGSGSSSNVDVRACVSMQVPDVLFVCCPPCVCVCLRPSRG